MMDYSALPIIRLYFKARTQSSLALPPYAGSMLRGAFGRALLSLCPLPHVDGKPCKLADRCAYCQVFSISGSASHSLQKFSHMPNAFVIEPPAGNILLPSGASFQFEVVLIGTAIRHYLTLILAFERALRLGLGPKQTPCQLYSVHQEAVKKPIWTGTGQSISLDTSQSPSLNYSSLQEQATLRLHTPLRLQLRGKPVRPHQLDARTFLVTLARRHQLLMDVCLGASAPQHDFRTLSRLAENIVVQAKELQWFDWGRFSQRQQREMKLGGLLGTFQLSGHIQPFSKLLHLGQWLHVGKNTSFGLGQYSVICPQGVNQP